MRRFIAVAFLITCVATTASAEGPAQLVGSVEAVYHEGLVTFQIDHQDAVSIAVKVYDLETDALVYDSGPRARTLVSWPVGHDSTGAFRYVVTAWNAQGEVVVSQAAATKNLTQIYEISFDTIPPNTTFLGPNEIIMSNDVQVGDPTPSLRLELTHFGEGGSMEFYEENGSTKHTRIEPDFDGSGGWFSIAGPSGGITAEGNLGGNSYLSIAGTSSSIFNTGSTGTLSVALPADAISATEIENEAGVAEESWGTSWSVPTSPTNAIVRTIVAPTSGYIMATAVVDIQISHSNGSTSTVTCSISETPNALFADGDQNYQISQAAPTGVYASPIAMTRIFAVTSGSHQLYVVCDKGPGGTATAFDRHFDILFVPTAHGTVASLKEGDHDGHMEGVEGYVSPNQALTQAEIDAERTESIAANLARIQAELDAIQAQADALRAASTNEP